MAKEYDNHEDAEAQVASNMGQMESLVESRNWEKLQEMGYDSNNAAGQPGYDGYEHSKS